MKISSSCPGWSFQLKLMGSRWGQLWQNRDCHALGLNPAELALAKVTFAVKVFWSQNLEVCFCLADMALTLQSEL